MQIISELDLDQQIIDSRDIVERYEELEREYDSFDTPEEIKNWEFLDEYTKLGKLIEELEDYSSELAKWGIILIREDYFTDYCIDLVQDIGDLPKDIPSYLEIDWEKTADNLKADYTEAEINGNTYYFR